MIILIQQQVHTILEIASNKLGDKYPKPYNCISFVEEVYEQVGVSSNFRDFPVLSSGDICKEKYIGYPCFLKHKLHGQHKRFTHVGIIAPDHYLFHYSRYFGTPGVREVFLTPFEKIFEVYNFAEPKFELNPHV